MKEEIIYKIARILNTWNPLGEKSKDIVDLDKYHYEAIDILSTINLISGEDKIEKAINKVLNQAFGIIANKEELSMVSKKIGNVLLENKFN